MMSKQKFVKIKITNERGALLEHFFLRAKSWGIPGGAIEDGETARAAAERELLERTGYRIGEENLEEVSFDGTTYLFSARQHHLEKIAEPGEHGGYQTSIRWSTNATPDVAW
ncbi:MAG: NUDIX hydrolase [Candidatus Vogelbacteria bacterium]|nr:NUDIX hydrolase [Candidatus Vogelbacteria bacterium]